MKGRVLLSMAAASLAAAALLFIPTRQSLERQLTNHQIEVGRSIAGIAIGDAKASILTKLGPPLTAELVPVDGRSPDLAMDYRAGSIGLRFILSPNEIVTGMAVWDDNFNTHGVIAATDRGVTIGTSLSSVVASYGKPIQINDRYGCPNRESAKMLRYRQFGFVVCHSGLVHSISIYGEE